MKITKKIDVEEIETAIKLLNTYVNDGSIDPVVLALEALIKDPDNEALITGLLDSLDSIGVMKGAVLSYAPYIALLVSNGLFEDE